MSLELLLTLVRLLYFSITQQGSAPISARNTCQGMMHRNTHLTRAFIRCQEVLGGCRRQFPPTPSPPLQLEINPFTIYFSSFILQLRLLNASYSMQLDEVERIRYHLLVSQMWVPTVPNCPTCRLMNCTIPPIRRIFGAGYCMLLYDWVRQCFGDGQI